MPIKHLPLNLKEEHFQAWLDLWRRNCSIHLPAAPADEMITLAETVGKRLLFITGRHAAGRENSSGIPPVGFL